MTTAAQARIAIAAILASSPDKSLPKPRMEKREERDIAWFGGRGFHIGSGTRNGEPHPVDHRGHGIQALLDREAAHRIELKHWETR